MDFWRSAYGQNIINTYGYILNNTINNYTKDFDFLWDANWIKKYTNLMKGYAYKLKPNVSSNLESRLGMDQG
jgi:hypothetical protein